MKCSDQIFSVGCDDPGKGDVPLERGEVPGRSATGRHVLERRSNAIRPGSLQRHFGCPLRPHAQSARNGRCADDVLHPRVQLHQFMIDDAHSFQGVDSIAEVIRTTPHHSLCPGNDLGHFIPRKFADIPCMGTLYGECDRLDAAQRRRCVNPARNISAVRHLPSPQDPELIPDFSSRNAIKHPGTCTTAVESEDQPGLLRTPAA